MRLLTEGAVRSMRGATGLPRRPCARARAGRASARPAVRCEVPPPPGVGAPPAYAPPAGLPAVGRPVTPAVPSVRPSVISVPKSSPSAPSGQEPNLSYGTPRCGMPEPLGASMTQDGGINFAVFSSGATAVSLCLFREDDLHAGRVSFEVPLHARMNRTGDVWHVRLDGTAKDLLYGYRLDGANDDDVPPPTAEPQDPSYGHRYNKDKVVVDPYATMVIGRRKYGELGPDLDYTNNAVLGLASTWVQEAAAMPFRDSFDWEGDKPLGLPMKDLVIYEMHVRGFTADASSGASQPGTYAALSQKLDYLADLGVNALELLPIQGFNELEYYEIKPGASPRFNFWGYSTCNFFSPMTRYSAAAAQGGGASEVSSELKNFVKQAHKRGMEVILDVVFNHTAEGNEMGPSISFRGLDNRVYYMLAPEGQYYNYSGCGNTFNCNHPVAARFVLDCLKFWVTEYHIDGFRFDLASILTRAHSAWQQDTRVGPDGEVQAAFSGDGGSGGAVTLEDGAMSNGAGLPTGTPLPDPPLIEEISMDPVLANTKLIAEAWDCDGLNQVGAFPHYGGRWAEWNGSFRDTVRQFMKGTDGPWVGAFAEALCGSPDTYGKSEPKEDFWWGNNGGRKWVGGRSPEHSVNFITAHDGFTLADLVAYNDKHNDANGEGNNDGEQHNLSWNCGAEGPTGESAVLRLRQRQMRNLMAALLVAQGVPMILMGDEYGHTKGGNNNTYCHDDKLNWHDWTTAEADPSGLRRFVSSLVKFRHSRPELGLSSFPDGRIIQWHGEKAGEPDWSDSSRMLALTLAADPDCNYQARGLYVAWNTSHLPVTVELPLWQGSKWVAVADTSKPAPLDFLAVDDKLSAADVAAAKDAMSMWTDDNLYPMLPRSCVILESLPIASGPAAATAQQASAAAPRQAAAPSALEFGAPPPAAAKAQAAPAPTTPGRDTQWQAPPQPEMDAETSRMMEENRKLMADAQRRGLM